MNVRYLLLTAPLAAVLACGGSTTTGAGSASLDAAVPTFAKLAIDQVATDTNPPAATATPTVAAGASAAPMMGGAGGVCHPHLFEREREVVERVNRHVYKALRLVERVVATNPVSATEHAKTWTRTENGVDVSFTITLVDPNVYSWTLAAGPTGTTPLAVVLSGEINRNGYTGAHEGKGTLDIDFVKLHAAFPGEKAATGTLEVRFDVSAAGRTIAARATDLTWDLDPARFDGGIVPAGLTAPRDGAYLYHREPGKGGSLKIQDEMVFLCAMAPAVTNPTLTPASTQVVSRWYHAADGSFHGRTDGKITGGQLVAPVASIVGTVCHSASGEQAMPDREFFWMMKAEDAAGLLVPGLGMEVNASTGGATPACDPAYGAVPVLANADLDFKAWPDSYFDDPFFPFLPPSP
jgi:hypothetical protein